MFDGKPDKRLKVKGVEPHRERETERKSPVAQKSACSELWSPGRPQGLWQPHTHLWDRISCIVGSTHQYVLSTYLAPCSLVFPEFFMVVSFTSLTSCRTEVTQYVLRSLFAVGWLLEWAKKYPFAWVINRAKRQNLGVCHYAWL